MNRNNKLLFSNINITDLFIIIILLVITLLMGYFYANTQARHQLWQQLYPVRASLSLTNLSCSNNAPSWMRDVLISQTRFNNAPSNQIAYIDKAGELHHCENGYMTQYPLISKAVNAQTRFRYASVTKLWTSDTILDLVKQGKVNLDDKLSKYITEINAPQDKRVNDITIEQLLLHRGGFDRTRTFGNDMFNIGEPICPDYFERLNHIKLGFTPDSKMSYSNLGYCLLGEVIARVEGRTYKQVIVDKYNFDKSNLKFISNNKLPDEVFYNYVETGLTGISNIYTEFDYESLASSAGLSGNAINLALQVNKMADKPSPNIMSLSHKLTCHKEVLRDCYGYAMVAYKDRNNENTIYFRDGALLGLSSLVAVTDDNQVVALLSNGTPKNGQQDNDQVKMKIYKQLLN